jgi:hypothetical protein
MMAVMAMGLSWGLDHEDDDSSRQQTTIKNYVYMGGNIKMYP